MKRYIYLPDPTSSPTSDAPGQNEEYWVVARCVEEARAKLADQLGLTLAQVEDVHLAQDDDVLDTWFSSGLYPFAAVDWPDEAAPDFQRFFPGNVLATGHDILFFWVARMAMLSLGLTEQLPFTDVCMSSLESFLMCTKLK